MRVWDLPPEMLCHRHLLGEHAELHALWTILTEGRRGYSNHPETKRWKGKLLALYRRHESLVHDMRRRGFKHRSPLDRSKASGLGKQTQHVNTPDEQRRILRAKGCGCRV